MVAVQVLNSSLFRQTIHEQRVVFCHYIIVWMLSFYLLADIASGFFVLQLGIDLKISLLYKMVLFVCLLLMIARYQFNVFIVLLSIITLLLVSPVAELFRLPVAEYFIADFSAVIKILMPLTVFMYFASVYQVNSVFVEKWLKFALFSNFTILLVNLAVGALGFGRPSYALANDETAGSNGYIYAANELGATLIVLFGFVLHMFWNHYRKYYIVMAVLTLLCGVLVATKTAMLAAILLIFLVPLFNERQVFFRLTWLKIKLLVPATILVITLIIFIVDFLKGLGLYDRMMWILSQKGIIGVIWSGRNEFSAELLNIYVYQSTLFQQVFGQGGGGVAEHVGIKYSAEVDAVDTLVWFGFMGLLICLAMPFYFIGRAAKIFLNTDSLYAPCVLLVNLILLFLSQLSGHVWMSGTLGISLGLLNALLLLENTKSIEYKERLSA
ncbi:O-antigen ligase family protein [Colwellia sp. TT2012]|uniref:O-antigen ligase family protein n=1 Tax=Colwellia sp. TT2012 TaxID=1720342 RepID=UPI00070DCBB0|nr:O-antigen ligase family protein [Colwellia sp. TT2012]